MPKPQDMVDKAKFERALENVTYDLQEADGELALYYAPDMNDKPMPLLIHWRKPISWEELGERFSDQGLDLAEVAKAYDAL